MFKYLDEPLKRKIPQDLIEHYNRIKNNDYNFILNKSLPLEKQNLMPETINIFSFIYLKYCCNVEERNNLIKAARAQKTLQDEEINAKYDFDVLRKNKDELSKDEVKVEENTSLVTTESTKWYNNIFEKIKSFFKNIFGK